MFEVVLVEPEIPPNTGNVGRLCLATGSRLHLVGPLGFSMDDRSLRRAGLDYWERVDLVVHGSLGEFLGTMDLAERGWLFSKKADRQYSRARFGPGDYLIFGRETKGLPGSLLAEFPGRSLRLPMVAGGARSLNLSVAVGIAVYEAWRQNGFGGGVPEGG